MSSVPTAYTALESLLLFQALRSEGVDSHSVFNRISDQLKSVPIVRTDPTYDSGRLSPDALRELYRWLLKEEVKRDLERENGVLQNGDVSPGSRKRKAPSPALPTVHEASQHAHLIPKLLTKLYTRYREHAVREIREHERRYDALSREISEIEAGKWDDRLQRQKNASATQSPRPSSAAHTQPILNKQDYAHPTQSSTASPTTSTSALESNTQVPPKKYSTAKIDTVLNHGPEPQNGTSGHRRTSSNTTLPPLSEMAPQSPRFGIPPKIPGPVSTQMQGHAFDHSPTSAHQSPYAPHHVHPSISSPQIQHALSRPSSSPRPILPPPPGMKLPPPSPVHVGSPNLRGPPLPPQQQHYPPQPPQHRLSTVPPLANDRPPRGYAPQQIPQTPSGYYQQQPYGDRRTSYPPPQQHISPAYQTQPPHAGGYQLPPFSVEPPEPVPRSNQPMVQQQPQTVPQQLQSHGQRPNAYPQYPQSAPSTAPRLAPQPHARLISDIVAALATPPRPHHKPLWKSERRPPNIKASTEMQSPQIEPLSPVQTRAEPAGRSTRSTRNRDAAALEHSADPEILPRTTRRRAGTRRDRSPHSIVSSTADESARMTRSQSVSTAAGALPVSDDRPGSRGRVKPEPSTPAGFVEAVDFAPDSQFTTGGPMTRKRRGTLQSLPQQLPKRKRQQSPSSVPAGRNSEDVGTPPPPRPNSIIATRNFHKLSATIMNDINSHKHASYFANLVRDKDAPGYSEIIKQPQHLKAIRMAIAAGAKAVNAAAANVDSPSATADGSTIELERTVDLIPPKAIVNGAQLEKEVVRMFANAVMFNPGEDGMVSDTREMFEDVEAKIREWKGAEKEGEREEVVGDEGKGKRRKL